ncbi:hypothetical protein GCM10022377_15560 [Zhihengliuella alba]|uniref:Glycosyltransferase n=1 Tax=Zhihengliuella alba TaxID=547018 RepID=A0ABP7DCN6_9MICC
MIADARYVLPLRWHDDAGLPELASYLQRLVEWIPVTVVDGSAPELFRAHAAAFPAAVVHLPPRPWPGGNGKVAGVMTGVAHAAEELLVLADDDVRYTARELERLVALLAEADLVRPQNYFAPLPWHARWDTGRILLNRAFGADYPGTVGVRRSRLLAAGGYDGDVLFENLELMRTIRAAGGRQIVAGDLCVRRVPPSTRHFAGQRIRQAYDDFAQPARLLAELSLAPVILWGARRPARLLLLVLTAIGAAWWGRRGAEAAFQRSAPLWAPAWVLERAVCVWLAVGYRLRGGVPYAGGRLKTAAHSAGELRRRHMAQRHAHQRGEDGTDHG